MNEIHSVAGTIDESRLGSVLMHEHVVLGGRIPQADRDVVIAQSVELLKSAADVGVRTVVDVTTREAGRDVSLLAEVSEQSGIQIICATGAQGYSIEPGNGKPPSVLTDQWLWYQEPDTTPDDIAKSFAAEIADGIDDTGIRASIIKVGTDSWVHWPNFDITKRSSGLTEFQDKMLRATARAHRMTGAPITTHTYVGDKNGLEQQRIFREEGVDLSRVVIGHTGDSTDFEYLTSLLEAGSFIGMDRFANEKFLIVEKRVATIVELCRRGYASQMMLAHDGWCWRVDANSGRFLGSRRMTQIHGSVVPELRRRGVSVSDIEGMLVENPMRYFARGDAY